MHYFNQTDMYLLYNYIKFLFWIIFGYKHDNEQASSNMNRYENGGNNCISEKTKALDSNSSEDDSGDDHDDGSIVLPTDFCNDATFDVKQILSLPSTLQKSVIEKAKREQRLQSRREFMPVAADPGKNSNAGFQNIC